MTALIRALNAERLKMKRSLAWWLVALGPVAVTAIVTLMYLQRPTNMWDTYANNPWMSLATNALGIWSVMFVLLFIPLQTALLGNLEHHSEGWKQIFALPNPRWATYVAKQIVILAMIAASTVILVVSALGVALLLGALNLLPDLNFSAPVDWGVLLRAGLLGFVGSWLIIAIHTWIALRWRSFAFASVVGIIATMGAIFAFNSDSGWYFPWAMPGMVNFAALGDGTGASTLPLILTISIVGALVVTLFGAWDVTHRDVL